MLITISKQFSLLIIITAVTYQASASKCGLLNCDAQAECKFNRDKDEFYCVCEEGLTPNTIGNNIECNKPDPQQCLEIGAECGPQHICNTDMVCQETHDNNVEIFQVAGKELVCSPRQQKCLNKCCLENETCQNGKTCMAKETTPETSMAAIGSECPENRKCLNNCCAHNEVCSEENECVKETNPSQVSELCSDMQQCRGKCCANNEICVNGQECVTKEPDDVECPKSQECLNKCCASTEICQNGTDCVAKESAALECLPGQLCFGKCCAEQEICSKENICVSKDSKLANQSNLSECPDGQQCENKCCASNEKCSSGNECVAQADTALECPESLKCLNKCCAENEVCDSSKTCIFRKIIDQECPEPRKCNNKCCAPNQVCNKENKCEEDIAIARNPLNCSENQTCSDKCNGSLECPPHNTGECHEMCGNKCCPINETCNDANECVIFIEVTTSNSCPEHQQCLNECCSPQQICNDLKRCVNKNLEEISNLYDFSNAEMIEETANMNNIDPLIPPSDGNDNKKHIHCPRDHYPCQHSCCNSQQICNAMGECVQQLNEPDGGCTLGQNCTGSAKVTNNSTSITYYTMIGLGCLVTVLSFALFKLHTFRRTQRNAF